MLSYRTIFLTAAVFATLASAIPSPGHYDGDHHLPRTAIPTMSPPISPIRPIFILPKDDHSHREPHHPPEGHSHYKRSELSDVARGLTETDLTSVSARDEHHPEGRRLPHHGGHHGTPPSR